MRFSAINQFFLSLFLIAKCQDFCDKQFKDNLIDSVFNFNDTIYVFRKPENVWLLKKDDITGNWSQIGSPIHLSDLFIGYDKLSFESAFGVSDYQKCSLSSNPNCLNENPDFDATDVTFVFNDYTFFIYRRVSERKFVAVDESDTNIPWAANRANTSNVTNFFQIEGRIDATIFHMPEGNDSFKRYVTFYSNSTVHEFGVNDMKPLYLIKTNVLNSPTEKTIGNGGILIDKQQLFIVNNKFWKYTYGISKLVEMDQTSWQYFNCDYVLPSITTTVTPNETISETDNENPNELTSSNVISTEETERSEEQITITSSSPLSSSESGKTEEIDEESRKTVKLLIILLLICCIVTAILVTTFAIFAFKIVSDEEKILQKMSKYRTKDPYPLRDSMEDKY